MSETFCYRAGVSRIYYGMGPQPAVRPARGLEEGLEARRLLQWRTTGEAYVT